MKNLFTSIALCLGLLTATGANASLIASDGGKTVFDTDLNIYWLADANYARTSGYNAYGGRMTWGDAQSWIAGLNSSNYLGYSDWRLPTTTDTGTSGCNYSTNGTDCGYNSTGSEMSHLYYTELGNKGYYNTAGVFQSGYGLVNDPANPNDESLFQNLVSFYYWSGTEYAPNSNYAWYFNTDGGYQVAATKDNSMFAMAVRPGQVAAVPVPATAWLLGSGLLVLIGVGRRRLALR